MLTINGNPVEATEFAYDGCHKIYLIFNEADRKRLVDECGYEAGDIHPIKDLPEVWEGTCPLRFISPADLVAEDIVAQGDDDPEFGFQ